MSPAAKSAISVGVKTTVIGALVIAMASMAKEYVIYRPEFNAHLKNENTKLDALLTLQCRVTPDDTICRDYR